MRTSTLLAAMVVPVAFATHVPDATASARKGFRAVVFSGVSLKEPVRVEGFDQATELYLGLIRGTALPTDSLGILNERTCIQVSVFIYRENTLHIPIQELRGDFNYRLYLFGPGVPPVLSLKEGIARRLTPYAASRLSELGVPVSANEPRGEPCVST